MLITCISVYEVNAQQQEGLPTTQYMLTTLSYNPGFAGLSNGICASLLHRQQWLGFSTMEEGGDKKNKAPNTTFLLIDAPIKAIKGGISLELASENYGDFNDVVIKLGYAYHLNTSFGKIGLGVNAILLNKNLNSSVFRPIKEGDETLYSAEERMSAIYGDVSVGAYLQGNQNYFVGVAVSQLVSHKSEKIGFRAKRILTINGGYTFKFPSLPKVEFTPTTLIETDFVTVQWNITAMATFNRRFWTGINYRMGEAVSILAGMNIKQFRVGVAYDIPASRLLKVSAGGFELFVKYCFSLEGDKHSSEYKNSRYL